MNLNLDLNSCGTVLVLEFWPKFLSTSVPLCVHVCSVACWLAVWSSLDGQSKLYHGRPFSKGKCAAQLPEVLADNTKGSEDNTSKKLLEPEV